MASILARLKRKPQDNGQTISGFPGYGNIGGGGATWLGNTIAFLTGQDLTGDQWSTAAGRYDFNSIVSICLSYIAMKGIEAPAIIQQYDTSEKTWTAEPENPIQALLDAPNPYYDGSQLIAYTLCSLVRGNGYWILIPANDGTIAQIWWAPHDGTTTARSYGMMPWIPPGDSGGLPTCYRYIAGGRVWYYPLEQVIHFRRPRPDWRNPFWGEDPLFAQERQIATDQQQTQYNYTILRRLGVPGAVFSPKIETMAQTQLSPQAKDTFREEYADKVGGMNRGDPLVLDNAYDVNFPRINPGQLAAGTISDEAEERIPAAFGLNRLCLGLGADGKYSNMQEAFKAGWDNCIAPNHTIISTAVTRRIMPIYGYKLIEKRLWFDYDNVPMLQEDEDALHKRWRENFKDGLVKRSVALSKIGLELPEGDKDGYAEELKPVAIPMGGNLEDEPISQPKTPNKPTVPADAPKKPTAKNARQFYKQGEKIKPATMKTGVQAFIDTLPHNAQQYYQANQAANNIDRAEVADAMNTGVARAGETMVSGAQAYTRAEGTLTDFSDLMNDDIINLHGAQAALGYGGMENMTEERWQAAADKAQFHIDKFAGFEEAIVGGEYADSPDGLVARSQLYANAGRSTYENTRMDTAKEDYGAKWAVRVLADVEHCEECDALGGVIMPIDEMTSIGSCECLANCACVIESSENKEDLE